MLFTTVDYLAFFLLLAAAYWVIGNRTVQNILLLIGSYVFYGWVHPWFCYLIAASTICDYICGLGMLRFPARKKAFLIVSLIFNLGLLGVFKYCNFFVENVQVLFFALGFKFNPIIMDIFLPVGISFYTFQTLSYTIDIYRGELEPRKSFLDFAVFVSFFPQLVAGPIERAKRFLPQVEKRRMWCWESFLKAWPLIVGGYLKKMVVADNVSVYVAKIYMLEHPSFLLLCVGTLAFAVQILADFSAYTDIARGSAKLLGFDLIENFNSPYLAISPSDFWRRWHISFSSWIRDYLYVTLGGSRVKTAWQFGMVLVVTMGLSGLWHGAAWHFVVWGIYHGLVVFIYHRLGCGGRWRPDGWFKTFVAWLIMITVTMVGWALFRAYSISWLLGIFSEIDWGFSGESLTVAMVVLGLVLFYTIPLFIMLALKQLRENSEAAHWGHAVFHGAALSTLLLLARTGWNDFIYFQF